jgi:hypothetical protein
VTSIGIVWPLRPELEGAAPDHAVARLGVRRPYHWGFSRGAGAAGLRHGPVVDRPYSYGRGGRISCVSERCCAQLRRCRRRQCRCSSISSTAGEARVPFRHVHHSHYGRVSAVPAPRFPRPASRCPRGGTHSQVGVRRSRQTPPARRVRSLCERGSQRGASLSLATLQDLLPHGTARVRYLCGMLNRLGVGPPQAGPSHRPGSLPALEVFDINRCFLLHIIAPH